MRVLSYHAERLPHEVYDGKIEVRTDFGDVHVCFSAENFCIHDGEFYTQESLLFSQDNIRELGLRLSSNGTFMRADQLKDLETALKEHIVSGV